MLLYFMTELCIFSASIFLKSAEKRKENTTLLIMFVYERLRFVLKFEELPINSMKMISKSSN